ncbi:DsrE family protein [Rhodoferax sp. 4810]|nr:DsrE family protein [Rhodoferax jenense]
MNINPTSRRHLISGLAGLAAATASMNTPAAPSPAAQSAGAAADGNTSANKIVYQLNKADPEYQEEIFNSVSAMLGKFVDDISIVLVVWGPGIHILAKNPKRPVSKLYQQRVRSMAESYGVKFIACENTMKTVGWTAKDMQEFVEVEDFGASAIMRLQQQGYAYLAW